MFRERERWGVGVVVVVGEKERGRGVDRQTEQAGVDRQRPRETTGKSGIN